MDHVPSARQHDADGAAAPAGRLKRGLFIALCLALAAGFAALGLWQVERLAWKRDLIARVEARLGAPATPLPAFAGWSPNEAYTRVTAEGVFLHDLETPVQAVTDRGPGWWIVTPLRTGRGVVLVNRGFAPTEMKTPAARPAGQTSGVVRVSGLTRASEPGGGFLRRNAPEAGRWYSRDVAAIAGARGLKGPVAPYFIDADGSANPGGYPIGGLTVVKFRNSHLAYALTWFGLSGLSLASAALVLRNGHRG